MLPHTPYEVTSLLQMMKRKFSAVSIRGQELSNRQRRKQAGALNREPREQRTGTHAST